MTRHRVGSVLAAFAAIGYLGTAWLHSTAYDSITELAAQAPAQLESVVPALWLMFSFDLVILGLIVAVIAWRPSELGRLILVIAAVSPFGAAGLQLRYIGFVPPTAILLAVGLLTVAAAAVMQPRLAEPAP